MGHIRVIIVFQVERVKRSAQCGDRQKEGLGVSWWAMIELVLLPVDVARLLLARLSAVAISSAAGLLLSVLCSIDDAVRDASRHHDPWEGRTAIQRYRELYPLQ